MNKFRCFEALKDETGKIPKVAVQAEKLTKLLQQALSEQTLVHRTAQIRGKKCVIISQPMVDPETGLNWEMPLGILMTGQVLGQVDWDMLSTKKLEINLEDTDNE